MKKVIVLVALFVLVGCISNPAVAGMSGTYSDPVEAISTPIHLQYGPGSQRVAYSMDMKVGRQVMKMSFDTLYDIRKDGDELVSDIEIKNMKVKAGGKKNVLNGSLLVAKLKIEPSGKVLSQKFSSRVLDKKQINEMKKSAGAGFSVLELAKQDVVTGNVIFSGQNSLAQELSKQGFSVEGLNFEYSLAGYVEFNGEKALLVTCDYPNGKIKQAKSGAVVDFGINSYMILRPENLQYIYSESVMNISVPGSSEKLVMEIVMNEK